MCPTRRLLHKHMKWFLETKIDQKWGGGITIGTYLQFYLTNGNMFCSTASLHKRRRSASSLPRSSSPV
jgi:hypothetical protein